MKICPTCRRAYADNDLNFCLDDGTVLSAANESHEPPPETVLMNQPRISAPHQGFGTQPVQTPHSWNSPAGYSMQPAAKSSKTWIWAVGVLGLAVLLCGGGFVGFFAWVGSLDANGNKTINVANAPNTSNSKTPSNASNASNISAPNDRPNVQAVDLSKWVIKDSEFGETEYNDGDFLMSSRKKGFYYALVGTKLYKSENATVRAAVRNVDSAATTLGFGLIMHSDVKPLQKGYAFLIDSEQKRYRIVYHTPGNEAAAVGWTNFSAIKNGAAENILEVRDDKGVLTFFINQELVTTVRNVYGQKDGVAGLYAGDAIRISFRNLEIRR